MEHITRKYCTVVIRDEDYNVVEQRVINPNYSTLTSHIPFLLAVITLLVSVCAIMLVFVASATNKLQSAELSIKELEVENNMLIEKCKSLEYLQWDKNLHSVIGYYSIRPNTEISKERLYKFLNENKDVFLYPDIVYAQVVQESTVGKSRLYRRSNNLIGMKSPEQRETTAIGKTQDGYATYKNWQMCVLDRPLWDKIMFKHKIPTRAEYFAMLKRRYASDPNYVKRINYIIDTDYNRYRSKQ